LRISATLQGAGDCKARIGPILHKLEPRERDYDIRIKYRSLIDEFAFVAPGEVKLCAMFKSN